MLTMPVLLRRTFIDRFINSMHPSKKKIVLHNFPPVPIRMVDGAKSEDVKDASDIPQINDQDLTLLVTPTSCEPRCMTSARKVIFKALY